MTLTGGGYVTLGQAASAIGKFNHNHDDQGRFATAENAGTEKPADHGTHDRKVAFTGVLIDKRYDEVANITHCTYSTPLGTFTLEKEGYVACPPTVPAPF